MELTELTLKLPPDRIRALNQMAAERDVTVGQLLRDTIDRELYLSRPARAIPPRSKERLSAPVQSVLAAVFSDASDWTDLQDRLRLKGFELQMDRGTMTLYRWPRREPICPAADAGFSADLLQSRFQHPVQVADSATESPKKTGGPHRPPVLKTLKVAASA
jgi:hypothetical protein